MNATPNPNPQEMAVDEVGQQQQQPAHPTSQGMATPQYATYVSQSNQPLHPYPGQHGPVPPGVVPSPGYPAPSLYPHPYAPHVVPAQGYATMPQFGPAPAYAYAAPTPVVSMPQGQPPLMPMASGPAAAPSQWTCPDHERMVMTHHRDPRCPTCTSYWTHYESAIADPQFHRAHEEARARQQAAYFEYFNRARGEGSSEDISRLQDELRRAERKQRENDDRINEAWDTAKQWENDARALREENLGLRSRVSRLQRELDNTRTRAGRQVERDRSRSPRHRGRDDHTERRRTPPRGSSSRGDSYRPPPSTTTRQESTTPRQAPPPPPSHGPSSPTRSRREELTDRAARVPRPSERTQAHPLSLQPEFVQGSSRSAITTPEFVQGSSRSAMAPQPRTHPSRTPSASIARVPGPEAVDYELSDDDSLPSDEDGINLKEVKSRIAKQRFRKDKKSTKGAGAATPALPRERLSPEPGADKPAPPILPAHVPRADDVQWPPELRAVHETDIRLADAWYNFVPIRHRQAVVLMDEARAQMAGAFHRVRHLIQQVDEHPGYMGVRGLATLKREWRAPRRARSTASPATSNVPPAASATPRVPMQQPRHTDTPEAWQEFYRHHPRSIPPALRIDLNDPEAIPTIPLIRANLLFRRFVPTNRTSQRNMASPRAAMLDSIARVFSVHGLYERIRTLGEYPIGPVENIQPFPNEFRIENISWYDVVRWAARCGISYDTVMLLEYVTRFYRNESLGRPVTSVEPWPNAPRSLEDAGRVPLESEMSSMPFPADVMTADTDSMQLDMDAADGTIEDDVSMRDEHTVHVPSQDETPDGGSVQTTTEPSSNAADPA